MVQARDDARKNRDFATADDIREVLQSDWGVALDDDLREWWVGDRKDNRDRKFGGRPAGAAGRFGGGGSDDSWGGGGSARDGGWGGGGRGRERAPGGRKGNLVPFSEPFRRSADDDAPVDAGAVGEMIQQREEARKSRDYRAADDLRDALSREFQVNVTP